MDVRRATPQDYPEMVRLARQPHSRGPLSEVGFREEDFLSTVQALECWVAEDEAGLAGMLGGLVLPLWYNTERRLAQEIFLWVDPARRGAGAGLVSAFERWAREQGVDAIVMVTANGIPGAERTRKFFQTVGYTPAESSFVRYL